MLRTGSGSAFYKAIEAPEEPVGNPKSSPAAGQQQHSQAAASCNYVVQNVDVEFIPTLNFVFQASEVHNKSAGREHERQQHVAERAPTACDNIDSSGANSDGDNASTHTYIISRSSFTAVTSSSSTPYAVTSTDTAELLRQQNNLSLTENDNTISSFSIEPPTSSITIDMAEPQQHTAATTSEATSSGHVAPRIATATTTTTSSSSIEEDIEEAIEISEVEEQLHTNLDSLSEAAAFTPATTKHEDPQLEQSAKSESGEEAAKFRIDDAQLSGGQLAQHFLVDEEESDEDHVEPSSPKDQATTTDDDDDFDISLPLEQRKPVHSRHEDDVDASSHGQDEGGESLSNQSTTDDVSDFVDEPQQTTESALDAKSLAEQEHASTIASAVSEVADHESKLEESELEIDAEAPSEQDHSMEEIVATNESIEITYDGEEAAASHSQLSASQKLEMVDLDLDGAKTPEAHSVEHLNLPQIQMPQIVEHRSAKILETLHLRPEPLDLITSDLDDDEDEDEECEMQLLKLRLMAMHQQTLSDNGAKGSPTESPALQEGGSSAGNVELKQMERVPLTEFSKDVLEDITEESERLLSISTTAEEPKSLSLEESKTLQEARPDSNASLVSLNMLKQLEAKVQDLHSQLETKDNCLASLNLQLEAARRESSAGPASARDSSSLVTNSTEYRTFQEEFGAPVRHYCIAHVQ